MPSPACCYHLLQCTQGMLQQAHSLQSPAGRAERLTGKAETIQQILQSQQFPKEKALPKPSKAAEAW